MNPLLDQLQQQRNRWQAWDALEKAYSDYAAAPDEPRTRFRALRALLKACRLHDLSPSHAAMLAELGRVDDEAPEQWQLVLQRRKPTRPHREKQERDKRLKTSARAKNRQWLRFQAVMDRIDEGHPLPKACALVAASERSNVTGEAIRQDYLVIRSQHSDAGREAAEFGNDDAIKRIPFPKPGRPRKKG